MNYRYYLLKRLSHKRDSSLTLDPNKRLRSLKMTLDEWKFAGTDQIVVLDFLTRFTEEADLNSLTEGQAFISLPRFLSGEAEIQYRASRNGARSGVVSCWPEAVQHLLTSYATPSAIREAVNDLQNIRQRSGEDEAKYSSRLNEAAYRCGNVHTEPEKMTFFINGLVPEIQSIVARKREETPDGEI